MLEEYKECRQALKEVKIILNHTNLNDVSKIPVPFIEFIEENADEEYKPTIDFEQPLEKQELKQETINILSIIYLKYWCDTVAKKQQYEKILQENEEKYQAKLREEYSPDNIFSNRSKKQEFNDTEKNNLPAVIEKENIFKKIMKWIKKVIG